MATSRVLKFLSPKAGVIRMSSSVSRFALMSTQTAPDASIRSEVSAEEQPESVEVDPLKHEDFFGVKKLVTVKDLMDSRVHLGHKSGCRSDEMAPYLFGKRLHTDIFDLDQTLPLLHSALNFTAHIAYRGGIIMFISRNKQNIHIIEKTAFESGEYSHCRRWTNGSFTNAAMQYGATTRLPNLCIFMNTLDTIFEQHYGVVECAKLLIPTIGIMDSNCDPRLITYPVPGNDDTPCAIQLYCNLFKKAILLGKERKKERDEILEKERHEKTNKSKP